MDWKEFLSHPLSSIRQWTLEHERFIAVNVSWTLAVVFIIESAGTEALANQMSGIGGQLLQKASSAAMILR